MYQIQVTWVFDQPAQSYEFASLKEARAFQKALDEANKLSGHIHPHTLIKDRPHHLFTVLSTLLVGLWAVGWWHLITSYFPNAILIQDYWRVGVCASLAYIATSRIASWFEA